MGPLQKRKKCMHRWAIKSVRKREQEGRTRQQRTTEEKKRGKHREQEGEEEKERRETERVTVGGEEKKNRGKGEAAREGDINEQKEIM